MHYKRFIPNSAKRAVRHVNFWTPILFRQLIYGDPSLAGESRFIEQRLGAQWPKYLVDVGANDGKTFSNSRRLLRRDSEWRALLIEAHPANHAKCQRLWRNNANIECLQVACSDIAGTCPLYLDKGGHKGGLTATLCDDDHPDIASRKTGHHIYVEVVPLSQLLDVRGWPRDFSILTVDVEGMDFEVLRGLDLARYRPRIIVTESYEPKEQMKAGLLCGAGYKPLGTVGCDSVWGRVDLF